MTSHHHQPNTLIGKLTMKGFHDILPRIKNNLKENYKNLGYESMRARRYFFTSIHFGLNKDEIAKHLVFAQNLAVAAYRISIDKSPFKILVWDEEITFTPDNKSVGKDYLIYPEWKRAFDLSVLRRRTEDLFFLTQVPETLLISNMSSTPEFDIACFQFLSHFFKAGGDTGPLLIRCFELLLQKSDNPVRDSFLNAIAWPELKLYEALIRRDQKMIFDKMKEANDAHRNYWGQKNRKHDDFGWVSLPIMSVSAIINDNSELVIPESPYVYLPIVTGNI